MKKVLLLCFIVVVCTRSAAQISIGYYPFQSEIAVSTNTERSIWGDIRLASNTFFGNVTTETIGMVNIKKGERANYYLGAGVNFNFFNAADDLSIINGYTSHVGVRAKPFKALANVQCIFEVSPYLNRDFDGGIFRTRLGLAYQFAKRNKEN